MRGRGTKKAALLSAVVLFLFTIQASGEVIQQGNLRTTVHAQVQPFRLPRRVPAPIAVFLAGHVGTVDGEVPPQLQRMTVQVNRHGLLQRRGLPSCALTQIQPGSTRHALEQCADALVGSGRFWASVVFPDQRPYPTRGRLLVFNGRRHGRPVIFAHIYTTQPFNTSFVITFGIKKISSGPYGTELSASLPQALGNWGFVDRIKLTLRRKYHFRHKQLSFFNASCPALPGTNSTPFPLAKTSFYFAHSHRMSVTVNKVCGVSR